MAWALCDTTFASLGEHAITATYSGDEAYEGSTGAWPVPIKYGADLALAGTPNPSQIGEPVTFSATLTAIDPISDLPTSAIPTGTVVFAVDQPEDPSRQHEATVDANGVATWTTSDLTLGAHEIYATYLGDANFAPTWVKIDAPLMAATTFTSLGDVLQPNGTQWVKVKQTVVFPFRGFFQPVDNLALNVAKAGSGIPVKFSLGGDMGLDILADGYPKVVSTACDTGIPSDAIETYTAGSSGLTYDAASDTYTYVWKTSKAWAGTCRQLLVRLDDGSVHTAMFRFK
jgi:hypothetical protein